MPASNRLGRYHLGERLGEGGMAEVFRAETTGAAGFTKAVAIKRIRPALAKDEHITAMFLQEAQVARRMEHGGIVQIYDLGSEDGVPYLVIELVDGVSLDRVMRERGQIDVADALALIEHVAAALHHAHRLTDATGQPTPVVHRDVNPRNILVSRDGVVKLTDFGIAKAWHLPAVTLPGTVKGTLGYLSPEQAAGAPVDARTDQFSTGVVLYELLAGHNPLAGSDSLLAYVRLLEHGLPRLPATGPGGSVIDDALSDIVARAVAVKASDRFSSMDDLRAALETWRVSRGARSSSEGLRRHVRAILGGAATQQHGPVALGDALRAQLEARVAPHTEARPLAITAAAAPAARPGSGRLAAIHYIGRTVALAVAGALVLAGGVALWRGLRPVPPSRTAVAAVVAPAPPAAQAAPVNAVTAPANAVTAPANAVTASVNAVTAPANAVTAPANVVLAPANAVLAQPAPAVPAKSGQLSGAAHDVGRSPPLTRPRTRGPGSHATALIDAGAGSAAAEPGRLKINLLPYARVTVNGQPRGQTPVDLALPAGAHQLALDNPDTGQRSERRIDIAPGQTLVIHHW